MWKEEITIGVSVLFSHLRRGMEEYHKNMSWNNTEEILVQRASGTKKHWDTDYLTLANDQPDA